MSANFWSNHNFVIWQNINSFNNSLLAEEKLISIVRNGDIDGLNAWIQSSPSVNPGLTSSNQTVKKYFYRYRDNCLPRGYIFRNGSTRSFKT